jgi:hypothetical protein
MRRFLTTVLAIRKRYGYSRMGRFLPGPKYVRVDEIFYPRKQKPDLLGLADRVKELSDSSNNPP